MKTKANPSRRLTESEREYATDVAVRANSFVVAVIRDEYEHAQRMTEELTQYGITVSINVTRAKETMQ